MLMSDILDAGTKSLDRQAFLDRLASYGATSDLHLSNLYSVWTLKLPIVDGKDYAALAALLAENWHSPRLTDETFRIAKRKLEAALEGGLDSDMSLGMTTTRRWIDRRRFGDYPITLDRLSALRLETVANVWTRDFLGAKEVWAGVVAPASSLPLVRSLLAAVFPAQGEIRQPEAPVALRLREVAAKDTHAERVFLVLDKPGRTQTMTSVVAVASRGYTPSGELAAEFGRHVLVESGLGSIFGEEIRTRRGLAYAVSGVQPWFLGHPSLGMAANPVRPKTDEALGVISGLLEAGFEKPSLIDALPQATWDRQWQSFLYGKLLDRSSPEGRIDERMEVAVGERSAELYSRGISKWKTDRSEVSRTLASTWADSVVVGAVVGDAKELEPLVRRHFPAYRTVVIPYRESVLSRTYE
jgi:hypothetical protein